LLGRDAANTPSQNKHLRTISRSGEHLLDLINDVLDMSKIDAGQLILDESTFDLFELLDTIESMIRLRASEKGLQLVFDVQSNMQRMICADERKLRQVWILATGGSAHSQRSGLHSNK